MSEEVLGRALRGDLELVTELLSELALHPWSGNVRELRSFAERAATLGAKAGWAITRGAEAPVPSRLPPPAPVPSGPAISFPAVPTEVPFKVLRDRYNEHLERAYITGMLKRLGRDVSAIAEASELDPTYVRRLLRKYEL